MPALDRREQLFLLWAVSASGVAIAVVVALVAYGTPALPIALYCGQSRGLCPRLIQGKFYGW